MGVTTNEPALPRPLAETGTIRRLGAEVLEYPVAPDDAVAGHRVRELRLPRDALLTVIVRGRRGRAAARLHARGGGRPPARGGAQRGGGRRWRACSTAGARGPLVSDAKPPRELVSSPGVFTSRPWNEEEDGAPSHPRELLGLEVRDHLRTRRDTPGALLVLVDGRYAITGPTLAVGGSRQVQAYARRRLARETDETARAWWQEVIGALAR